MTQPQRIMVAYDGTRGANAALTHLANGRAGLPRELEALVLCVADVWTTATRLAAFGPYGLDVAPVTESQLRTIETDERIAMKKARATALEASKTLRAANPRWTVRAEACANAPAWAIVKRAGEWRADLIVIGSHGRSALGRVVLGSVSHAVLREAPCSVRVVHGAGGRAGGPLSIVIGYDGSLDAEAAIQSVAARTWPKGSSACLVTAADARLASAGAKSLRSAMTNHRGLMWIEPLLARAAQRLTEAGLHVTSVVRVGDARRALVREAIRRDADEMFVGARGVQGVKRFLLGSVSTAVAMQARCPVEVVRSVCARVSPSQARERAAPQGAIAAGSTAT